MKETKYTDYSEGLVSTGTVWSGSIEVPLYNKKCFSFKSMRDGGNFVMIDKDEWERFLVFTGCSKTDEPCAE